MSHNLRGLVPVNPRGCISVTPLTERRAAKPPPPPYSLALNAIRASPSPRGCIPVTPLLCIRKSLL